MKNVRKKNPWIRSNYRYRLAVERRNEIEMHKWYLLFQEYLALLKTS